MEAVVTKTCSICGTDVSHQKRTKDPRGNYYCDPCYRGALTTKETPVYSAKPANGVPANTTSVVQPAPSNEIESYNLWALARSYLLRPHILACLILLYHAMMNAINAMRFSQHSSVALKALVPMFLVYMICHFVLATGVAFQLRVMYIAATAMAVWNLLQKLWLYFNDGSGRLNLWYFFPPLTLIVLLSVALRKTSWRGLRESATAVATTRMITSTPPPQPTGGFPPSLSQMPSLAIKPLASNGSPENQRACANCGAAFGLLEQGVEWEGHRICARCAEALDAEKHRREAAEAVISMQMAQRAAEEAEALKRRNAALSRAKHLRLTHLGYAVLAGLGGIICLIIPLFTKSPEDDADKQVWQTVRLGILALLVCSAIWNFWRYRRLRAMVERGDYDAIGKTAVTGTPAYVVTPIVAVLSLTSLTLFTLMGWGLGGAIEKSVSGGNGLAYWFCVPIGFVVGLFGAASISDQFRATFCPNCRRYFVATVLGREHAGTETRTYQRQERLYTKAIDGSVLAVTDVPVQGQEITQHQRVYCRCRNCGHEWAAHRSLTWRT